MINNNNGDNNNNDNDSTSNIDSNKLIYNDKR